MLESVKKIIISALLLSFCTHSISAMQFRPFSVADIFRKSPLAVSTIVNAQNNQSSEFSSIFTKTNIVCGALTMGIFSYGIYSLKQYYTMNQIKRWLKNSSPVKNAKDFRFSSFLKTYYPNASDILERRDEISNELLNNSRNEITLSDENNTLIKNPSVEKINEEINQEINSIKNDLHFLLHYTQLPILIASKLDKAFGSMDIDNKTIHNTILEHCKLCITSDSKLKTLEAILNSSNEQMQSTFTIHEYSSFFDRFIYRTPLFNRAYKMKKVKKFIEREKEKEQEETDEKKSNIIFYQRSKNPFTWSFVLTQKKATQLYYAVLKRYLRLLALKEIAIATRNEKNN